MSGRVILTLWVGVLLGWATTAGAVGPVLDHCAFDVSQATNHDLAMMEIGFSSTPGGPYTRTIPYPVLGVEQIQLAWPPEPPVPGSVGEWYPTGSVDLLALTTIDVCGLWQVPDGQYYVTMRALGYSGAVSPRTAEVAFVLARGVIGTPPQPPTNLHISMLGGL